MPLENIPSQINPVHTLFIWEPLLLFSKLYLLHPSDLFLNAFQLKVCMNLPYIRCVLIFPPTSSSRIRSLLIINVVERTTNHEAPHYAQFTILLFLLSYFPASPVPYSHFQQTFNAWKSEVLTNTSKQQVTQHSKSCSSSVLSLPQIKHNNSSPCTQVMEKWRYNSIHS
jgi:hypothetical protein